MTAKAAPITATFADRVAPRDARALVPAAQAAAARRLIRSLGLQIESTQARFAEVDQIGAVVVRWAGDVDRLHDLLDAQPRLIVADVTPTRVFLSIAA